MKHQIMKTILFVIFNVFFISIGIAQKSHNEAEAQIKNDEISVEKNLSLIKNVEPINRKKISEKVRSYIYHSNLASKELKNEYSTEERNRGLSVLRNSIKKLNVLKANEISKTKGIGPTELLVYILIGILVLLLMAILGIDLIGLLLVGLIIILILLLLGFL